eukprot:s3159_g9.t2
MCFERARVPKMHNVAVCAAMGCFHGAFATEGLTKTLACELPELDFTKSADESLKQFQELYLGRAAVVLRGRASGDEWQWLRRLWARSRLFANHGTRTVRPSDLHRGCGLAHARKKRTSVMHSAMAPGGGCCYLQPHHEHQHRWKRHEEAWMAQVYGKKLWLVGRGGSDLSADSLTKPCLHYKTAGNIEITTSDGPLHLRRCVTGPSDVIYVPDRWAHATCGLSSFNIGVGFIGSVSLLPRLHQASVDGDLQEALKSLQSKASALQLGGRGMLNENGLLPLHWAAWNGHLPLVALLLRAQEEAEVAEGIDEKGFGAAHALRWAAARGHARVTAFLARRAGQAADEQGTTPLHWAAATGHTSVSLQLLALKADPNTPDAYGARPVHFLAGEGHVPVLRLLLLHKANIEVVDEEGITATHAASQFGHTALLQELARAGADVHRASSTGFRPWHFAKAAGHSSTCEWLEIQKCHCEHQWSPVFVSLWRDARRLPNMRLSQRWDNVMRQA